MDATEAVSAATRTRRWRISSSLVRHIGGQILETSAFVLIVLELSYSLLIAIAVARQYDLDLPLALPVMWFTALSMLNDSVPISLLFGTSLVFGRLIADREVMAYKSFGLSYLQILAPVLGLALGFTICGYFVNSYLVPHMRQERRDVGGLLVDQFRSLGKGYNRDFRFGNINLWILHHDGRRLDGIFLAPRYGQSGEDALVGKVDDLDPVSYPYCVYAERGRVLFADEVARATPAAGPRAELTPELRALGFSSSVERDTDGLSGDEIWIELEGVSFFWSDELHPGGTSSFFHRAFIGRHFVPFDPAGSRRRDPGRKELVSPRLGEEIARTRAEIARGELSGAGAESARSQLAKLEVEYHDRLSRTCAYFLFPMLAGLIALLLNSPNRLLPFFVAAAIVPAIYYGSATIGQLLGFAGWPAAVVMQIGNLVLVAGLLGGIVLLEKRLLR